MEVFFQTQRSSKNKYFLYHVKIKSEITRFITQLLRSFGLIREYSTHFNTFHFKSLYKKKKKIAHNRTTQCNRYTCLELSPKKEEKEVIEMKTKIRATKQYHLFYKTVGPYNHTHSIPITIC